MKRLLVSFLMVSFVTLSACATSHNYNPSYMSELKLLDKIDGSAIINMSDFQRAINYSGNSTTIDNSAHTMNIPLGQVTEDIGEFVLNSSFTNGAKKSQEITKGNYIYTVEVSNFNYKYISLTSFSAGMKPVVSVNVKAKIIAPDGTILIEKLYRRIDEPGDEFIMSSNPSEHVNKILHLTIANIFKQMIAETADAEKKRKM